MTSLQLLTQNLLYDISQKLQACRSEEHTSELQSQLHLVCRLLLEKKNNCADHSAASCDDQNLGRESEFCAARRARERNHVADVWDAGDEHQHTLETETEAAVRHSA